MIILYVGTMFLCVVFSSWVEAVEMPCLRFEWKKTGLRLRVGVPGKLDTVLQGSSVKRLRD